MRASVYLFAVDARALQRRIDTQLDASALQTQELMQEKEVDAGQIQETLELIANRLAGSPQDPAPLEDFHAVCWLLEAVGEKVELYTLAMWKRPYLPLVGLDELSSSQPLPTWLPQSTELAPSSKFIAHADIATAIAKLQADTDAALEQAEVAAAREELTEMLESIAEDRLDAVLIIVPD